MMAVPEMVVEGADAKMVSYLIPALPSTYCSPQWGIVAFLSDLQVVIKTALALAKLSRSGDLNILFDFQFHLERAEH
jgi:hypothetical protein